MIINFLVTGSKNADVVARAEALAPVIAQKYPGSSFAWIKDVGGAENRPAVNFSHLYCKEKLTSVSLNVVLRNMTPWLGELPFDVHNSDPGLGFAPLVGYDNKGKPQYARPSVIAEPKEFRTLEGDLKAIYNQLVAAEWIDADDRLGKILSASEGDKSFFLPSLLCGTTGMMWFAVDTEPQMPTSAGGTRWYKCVAHAIGAGCHVTTNGGTQPVEQDKDILAILNQGVSSPTPTTASAAAVDASPVQPAPAAAAPRGFV